MSSTTPDELATTPELALMLALEASLDLTQRALVAAHPELSDPPRPSWRRELDPSCRSAEHFVAVALELGAIIGDYRRAALEERQRLIDDDLPF